MEYIKAGHKLGEYSGARVMRIFPGHRLCTLGAVIVHHTHTHTMGPDTVGSTGPREVARSCPSQAGKLNLLGLCNLVPWLI